MPSVEKLTIVIQLIRCHRERESGVVNLVKFVYIQAGSEYAKSNIDLPRTGSVNSV